MNKVKFLNSDKEYDVLFSLKKNNYVFYAYGLKKEVYFGKIKEDSENIQNLTKEEEELMESILNKLGKGIEDE